VGKAISKLQLHALAIITADDALTLHPGDTLQDSCDVPHCFESHFGLEFTPAIEVRVKKRSTEEQSIGFPKEAEKGVPVKKLCRKRGSS
jgi:hypothetical protein